MGRPYENQVSPSASPFWRPPTPPIPVIPPGHEERPARPPAWRGRHYPATVVLLAGVGAGAYVAALRGLEPLLLLVALALLGAAWALLIVGDPPPRPTTTTVEAHQLAQLRELYATDQLTHAEYEQHVVAVLHGRLPRGGDGRLLTGPRDPSNRETR